MSVDDVVRHVGEALARADSLFGSASPHDGLADDRLAEAAGALRDSLASDMSGAAVAGYRSFADDRAATLQRLADAEAALSRVLADAAAAENAAAAASRSTIAAAGAQVDGLAVTAAGPGGERALLAALQSEVARQQELVARHQQQAAGLADQVRLLSYE